MDRMKVAAVAVVAALVGGSSGCSSEAVSVPVDVAASQAPAAGQVVDPAGFEEELSEAAALCPGVLTPARLEASIDAVSGWRTGVENAAGARGLAQLPDPLFLRHAPAGSEPDDPRAAITAMASYVCDVKEQLEGPYDRGELELRDWDPTGTDSAGETELLGLTLAGVMAGPGYVLENGGASAQDANFADVMDMVMYA